MIGVESTVLVSPHQDIVERSREDAPPEDVEEYDDPRDHVGLEEEVDEDEEDKGGGGAGAKELVHGPLVQLEVGEGVGQPGGEGRGEGGRERAGWEGGAGGAWGYR